MKVAQKAQVASSQRKVYRSQVTQMTSHRYYHNCIRLGERGIRRRGKKLFSMSINNVTVQEADSELWYYKCLILHKISVDRKMLDVSGGVFIVFF